MTGHGGDGPAGEGVWRWGLELDAGRQLRGLRRVVSGRSPSRVLHEAVDGRRVLLTGASAGIGREVAVRVGRAGAEVLLVARRRNRLEEVAAEITDRGGSAHVLPCDMADTDAVDALAARVIADHGGVDVLVNNAGHSIRRTLRRSADRLHDFERVMRLNYFGAVHLSMPLVEDMRGRGGGHVVNVSTMGTQVGPNPRFAAYLASKSALEAFTRSAAPETRRDGVTWTTVHLPLVRTDMIAPTDAYDNAPALSARTAAHMVLDAIVRRPARVTHPFGVAMQVVDLVAPRRLEQLMGQVMGSRRPPERPH